MPPDPANLSSPEDCVALYERGFAGVYADPEEEAALLREIEAGGGYRSAQAAIYHGGFFATGEGKLSLPYLAADRLYPDCLPGGAQERGDCVSWSLRSAALVSYCASLVYGDNPDRYSPPAVVDAARQSGVFSTEVWYWQRGHGGEGWNCGAAAKVALSTAGMMPRRNYPEIGIDLTTYSGRTAGRWGAISPPPEIQQHLNKNLLSTATVCKTWEDVRDMLANGFAVMTCGGEAFSRTRDDHYGLCERSMGVWRHAMSFIAACDIEEVKRHYGCRTGGIVLVQNSWGNYCGGKHRIPGTSFYIPGGSFWARWEDVAGRCMVAVGGGKGFQAQPIPRLSLASII